MDHYLFAVDDNGNARRVPLDPPNVERQMDELRAAGFRPYLLAEDELIDLNRAVDKWRTTQQTGDADLPETTG